VIEFLLEFEKRKKKILLKLQNMKKQKIYFLNELCWTFLYVRDCEKFIYLDTYNNEFFREINFHENLRYTIKLLHMYWPHTQLQR